MGTDSVSNNGIHEISYYYTDLSGLEGYGLGGQGCSELTRTHVGYAGVNPDFFIYLLDMAGSSSRATGHVFCSMCSTDSLIVASWI